MAAAFDFSDWQQAQGVGAAVSHASQSARSYREWWLSPHSRQVFGPGPYKRKKTARATKQKLWSKLLWSM